MEEGQFDLERVQEEMICQLNLNVPGGSTPLS